MLLVGSFTDINSTTRFGTAWVRLMGGVVITMMLSNLTKHLEKQKAAQAQQK